MFSKLIIDIINESENNTNQCIRLLELASDLFSTDPVYSQTLARLFYIKVKEDNKYEEARKWAEEAIKRDPRNSYIRDTLGQVHKNHLLNDTKKQFSDLNVRLAIAQSAIKAFKDEEKAAENESEDYTEFNYRGLFGFLQVCKIIHPKHLLNSLIKNTVSSSVVSKVMWRRNMISLNGTWHSQEQGMKKQAQTTFVEILKSATSYIVRRESRIKKWP